MRKQELFIRIKTGSTIYEIIPHQRLTKDFPSTMLDSYVHLLDLKQRTLEFRPLKDNKSLWTSSSSHWVVSLSQWKREWLAHGQCNTGRSSLTMINYHSPIQVAISKAFQPIEMPQHIQVALSEQNMIEVKLHRYGLEFHLDIGGTQIACRNFPGMVVDLRPGLGQDMHTLYGLKNYLVLRQSESPDAVAVRMVIIPNGQVQYDCARDHRYTAVSIDTETLKTVTYHVYTIDTLLGRLVAKNPRSLLYKALLHALTSCSFPDPLTGVTGTEQALEELRSPKLLSLTAADLEGTEHPTPLEILRQLYNLTPIRSHSRDSRRTTSGLVSSYEYQSIAWDNSLPSHCQRGEFYLSAKAILGCWQSKVDSPSPTETSRLRDDQHLQERAVKIQAAYNPIDDVSARHFRHGDSMYATFDLETRRARVRHISRLSHQWTTNLSPTTHLAWYFARLAKPVRTQIGKDANSSIEDWHSLYQFCRTCSKEQDQYKLLFALSAFAISRDDDGSSHDIDDDDDSHERRIRLTNKTSLETLLAFATNRQFSPDDEIPTLQRGLDRLRSIEKPISHHLPFSVTILQPDDYTKPIQSLDNKFDTMPCPPEPVHSHQAAGAVLAHSSLTPKDFNALEELLVRFSKNADRFHQQYSQDLTRSWQALLKQASDKLQITPPTLQHLETYMRHCVEYMRRFFSVIEARLTPRDTPVKDLLYMTRLQPRITTRQLLMAPSTLNRRQNTGHAEDWKKVLVSFGECMSSYQRAARLYRHTQNQDFIAFTREWTNIGREGWNSLDHPEWLLFEIEQDIHISLRQAKTAQEMLCPTGGRNAIFQVNMGEGKSSVIVPIVATALANTETLVRVVVPRSLLRQMHHLLLQKLGGLLQRRIYYVPFSRHHKYLMNGDTNAITKILDVYEECMQCRGILLTCPEDLLSLRLTSIELLSKSPVASHRDLVASQLWINKHARDILDESDEVLNVRYEMIYTMGTESPVELGPQRWAIIQEILDLIQKHMRDLRDQYPHGIAVLEAREEPGSFPFIHLFEHDAEMKLVTTVAEDIVKNKLEKWGVPTHDRRDHRKLTFRFIISAELESEELSAMGKIPPALLLVRGLLGNGILGFILREKRWRVNYGLRGMPCKSNLAVPYRAKDSPAPRAYFAHPEITITLTCLTHYYQGLSKEQLRLCFNRLNSLYDPEAEYSGWIRDYKDRFPIALRQLKGVNVRDVYQWSHTIYPLLRMLKPIIDFYLSFEVFPKEFKQFPQKLTASSWDLAEEKQHPITGFSGTNDNRYLLPTTIQQLDLGHQYHTNAKVLSYVLGAENNFYECAQTTKGERLCGPAFLRKIADSEWPIQVLLDVGAHLLDMDNEQVAHYWLNLPTNVSSNWTAALFFNDNGEIMVMEKDGRIQSYNTSHYIENIGSCLLYLDEAYTRGTDLKLPPDSIAAVTLGPHLTKDKLLQGLCSPHISLALRVR